MFMNFASRTLLNFGSGRMLRVGAWNDATWRFTWS